MTVNSQRISLRAAWRGRWKFRWNLSFTRTSSNYPGKPVLRWFAQATYELNQYFSTWGVSLAEGNSNNFGKQLKKWCCHWYNNNNNNKKWLTIVIDVGEALKWNMTQKKLGNIGWDADSMRHFVISQCFYFFDNCLDFTGLQLKRIKMNKIIEICIIF